MWLQIEFLTRESRPARWPALGPSWAFDYDTTRLFVTAFWPKDRLDQVFEFWPDADDLRVIEEVDEIRYDDRLFRYDWDKLGG